ncbi:S1 RNA-binding domain-containing protein 1 [Ambystoma mexicanum]|uniref:S1 RNA-binding domain-containing protein 1 n=1 Tax=Ambystoma mexicanum TaxID=8296 RepID=UPI0037E84944
MELEPTRRTTRRPVDQAKEQPSYVMSSDSDATENDDDEWEPEKKKVAIKKKASAPVPKVRKPRAPTNKSPAKKKPTAPRGRKRALKTEDEDIGTPLNNEEQLLPSENAGNPEDVSADEKARLQTIKEERLSMVISEQDLKSIQGGLKSEPEATPKKKAVTRKAATPKPRKPKGAKTKKEADLSNDEMPSTSGPFGMGTKAESPGDDFTFGEPPQKKLKTSLHPDGLPLRRIINSNKMLGEAQMNWDLAQILSERTNVEMWVCANIINLFQDENTIPFIARYRKELINNMDADALREMHQALEEQCAVAKKAHIAIQKLKKEGKLNDFLHTALLNSRTLDEVEHVYAPFKTGSKGTKAQRARQLGLEPAAISLIETPAQLNLFAFIKPEVEGLSNLLEVQTGVQHILADMVAKDKDSLERIRKLCQHNYITLQSALAKTTTKDGPVKDVDKFHLYHNFSANINRIQHHQILAINRGENLKVLTVKVNIPDRVKDEFCRWCVNERWRPRQYAKPEFMNMLRSSVEDSYKRLIYPLLCREYRSKLTSDAEKESIMMFGRNLRQLLLAAPVRGRTLMGVDPGYKHGCKLALISPTNQILHADVVYLHTGSNLAYREAEKIRSLLINYKCNTVVIGNGTACRETERYFADLIQRRFFAPLDVVYCIANEAGASIYSVSPEAAKEMPGLDPNLRSAVSIARRVQDPLAELVKIEPKHIGVGMYQHDVSQILLKAALDSVVEECVSFVGVDINICSETLLRHIAGLNANRAKNIIDWREKNGPFINREHLKSVKGLGPKSFQQCAGFIRVNQEYIKNFCSNQQNNLSQGAPALKTGVGTKASTVKKKGKAAATTVQKPNPLDQTCIHPESYDIAMRFLTLIDGRTADIGKLEMQNRVNALIRAEGIEAVAQKLATTGPTLQTILDGLCQPEGYDLRTEFDKPDFKTTIVCLEDLKIGTILTGKVENATLFGVFVDVGVGRAGLIPMRYLTEAKLSKDRRRRSLGLGPGERVEVKVINIDIRQSRITLELIRVL